MTVNSKTAKQTGSATLIQLMDVFEEDQYTIKNERPKKTKVILFHAYALKPFNVNAKKMKGVAMRYTKQSKLINTTIICTLPLERIMTNYIPNAKLRSIILNAIMLHLKLPD